LYYSTFVLLRPRFQSKDQQRGETPPTETAAPTAFSFCLHAETKKRPTAHAVDA
jgi:hypothetical protein